MHWARVGSPAANDDELKATVSARPALPARPSCALNDSGMQQVHRPSDKEARRRITGKRKPPAEDAGPRKARVVDDAKDAPPRCNITSGPWVPLTRAQLVMQHGPDPPAGAGESVQLANGAVELGVDLMQVQRGLGDAAEDTHQTDECRGRCVIGVGGCLQHAAAQGELDTLKYTSFGWTSTLHAAHDEADQVAARADAPLGALVTTASAPAALYADAAAAAASCSSRESLT